MNDDYICLRTPPIDTVILPEKHCHPTESCPEQYVATSNLISQKQVNMKLQTLICILLAINHLNGQNYNITQTATFEFPGQTCANIWGYAAGGKEYALVGTADGMTIIDVTNPASPVLIEQLTDGISSQWREIKTYGNYAYITSEGLDANNEGGLGIANLSDLPNVPVPFKKYKGDGAINGLLRTIHALDVDEAQGFVYLYGPDAINPRGIVCLDLSDPWNPTYAGKYQGNYVHDGYTNNNIVYGSHIIAGYFSIIDFTNKANPIIIATQTTPNAFTHNTWPSLDGNYLFTTDEKSNSFLTAYDISNPNNIFETDRIATTPGSGSIVHNTYILDHFAVTSWYRDGVTITDVSRPGNLIQVGRYDTYPQGAGNGFDGAWGVYPYLPSQTLLVTNIHETAANGGVLHILTPTYTDACYLEGNVKDRTNNANLFGASVTIQHPSDPLNYTTTDLVGNYATGQPTPGTFNVQIAKAGYQTSLQSVTLSAGAVTQLDVLLEPVSLPVELLSFRGQVLDAHVQLEWETAVEENLDYFEVQRSPAGKYQWATLGRLPAAGSTTAKTAYDFLDKNPLPAAYYRLKSVDISGESSFSDVVHLFLPGKEFRLQNTYPIPTTGLVQLEIEAERERLVHLSLYDIAGHTLLTETFILETGTHLKTLQLPDSLPSGNYWIVLNSEGDRRQSDVILRR